MTQTIEAYHGTGDIEAILQSGAILSPNMNPRGDLFWNSRKGDYDRLTKEFADAARDGIVKGTFFPDTTLPPELLGNDEALADLMEEYGQEVVINEKLYEYKELKRGLCVYLTDDYDYASRCMRRYNHKTEGITELALPLSLLRRGFSFLNRNFSVIKVIQQVDLQYLRQVFVPKERMERTVQLLDSKGLEEVRVLQLH